MCRFYDTKYSTVQRVSVVGSQLSCGTVIQKSENTLGSLIMSFGLGRELKLM